MEKRDFNLAAKIFLGMSVLDIVLNIINAYTKYRVAFVGGETLIIEMIINFMILIAIVFTFMKKRWGLITLTVLYVIRMFAIVSYRSDISVAYQLGGNIPYLIRDFGFFAIAMCFKKNGVSGWKSMLSNNIKGEDSLVNPSIVEVPPILSENKANDTLQNTIPEESVPPVLTDDEDCEDLQKNKSKEQNQLTSSPSNTTSPWSIKRLYILLSVFVSASIGIGVLIGILINNDGVDSKPKESTISHPEKYIVIFDNGYAVWDRDLYLSNYEMLRDKRPEIPIYELHKTTQIDIEKYFYVTHVVGEGIWNGEKLLSKIAELKDTYPSCTVYQLNHIQGLYENEVYYNANKATYAIPLDKVEKFTKKYTDAKIVKMDNK